MDKTSQNQNTPAKPAGSNRAAAEIFDWVQTFCQALFAVVFIFTFLFRFVTVDGHSMDMTLADGDRLIISNIGYTPARGDIVVIHDTESQVLVGGSLQSTFQGPIIKRIIATAGETVIVDYENWKITVIDTEGNVHVLEEPYVNYPAYDKSGNIRMFDGRSDLSQFAGYVEPENRNKLPGRIPERSFYPRAVGQLESHTVSEGCVFVCGDNRNNSLDSRYVGDIDERKILGKVLWRVFPFTSFGTVGHVDYND